MCKKETNKKTVYTFLSKALMGAKNMQMKLNAYSVLH